MRRKRLSEVEWARLIEEYRESGLTQVEFAQRRELNVGTLRQRLYSSRRASNERLASGRFVEVQVSTLPGTETVGCRVRLGEVEVELTTLPSAAWLRSLAGLEAEC